MSNPLTATEASEEAWPEVTTKSRQWFNRALKVEPGGVQGDGKFYRPYPLFARKAQGARFWDVDGNEFVDYHAAFGPAVLGYNHPKVRDAVIATLEEQGPLFGQPHPGEVELAERISQMVPSAEKTNFVCSGTEATYHALRLARSVTGREKILKFEGHYHGWHDFVMWSVRFNLQPFEMQPEARSRSLKPVPQSGGLLSSIEESVVIREFNDFAGLEDAMEKHGEELAAIILEPICHSIGLIEPEPGFLERCRELCDEAGVVLIFDEVLTGFRHAPGGAQELLNVIPDLTAMGKAVANGFPLSLVTGKSDLMSHFTPEGDTYMAGTFNGQVLTTSAALACTETLVTEPVHERLNSLGRRVRDGIQEQIDHYGVKVQIRQRGSVWCLYFTDGPIRNFREIAEFVKDKEHPLQIAYREWMLREGIYIQPQFALRAFISYAHSDEDIDRTVAATGEFFREYKDDLT